MSHIRTHLQWWREEVSDDVAPDLCPSCVSYLLVRGCERGAVDGCYVRSVASPVGACRRVRVSSVEVRMRFLRLLLGRGGFLHRSYMTRIP